MISTGFAPNETWKDALISFSLLLQPWRWKKGNKNKMVKNRIENMCSFSIIKPHVSLFLTGRGALYNLLQSLHLPKGSEIIVQGFTCEAVILPIIANDLKPIYVDIETQTFSLDPVVLSKSITNKTKVVILQHTFGLTPTNRDKVLSIIKQHNLLLIEDIAHGYNSKLFTASYSQLSSNHCYLMSFGRSKALSSVFGGAIVSNDRSIISKITEYEAQLSQPSYMFILRLLLYKPLSLLIKLTYSIFVGKVLHKVINSLHILIPEITSYEKDGSFDPLLNKAYPNALSILLLEQLNKFEQKQLSRASICSLYQKLQSSIEISNMLFDTSNLPLLRYPILVKNPEALKQKMQEYDIFLGSWYDQVVAPKTIDLTKVQYHIGSCPNAEKISQHIVNLPTHISHSEALKVIEALP